MNKISRRQLAEYAADQLLTGESARKIAASLAAVLVESKRASEVDLLLQDIAWELEVRGKVANANITSANALTDTLRKELTQFIKKATKVEQVNLDENIDKSVIGGVRIETATHAWDKTIATKLMQIREAF